MESKIKRVLAKPVVKKKEVVQIKETVKIPTNLLNEAVIFKANDKELLYHAVESPGNRTFILSTYADTHAETDRTVVASRKSGTMVLLVYRSEFIEVTDFLIKMCDEMGYQFVSNDQKNPEITAFEIFVH